MLKILTKNVKSGKKNNFSEGDSGNVGKDSRIKVDLGQMNWCGSTHPVFKEVALTSIAG